MSEFAGVSAAEAIREALARCNAGAAFGLPGSPNHALFQRLRGTNPRLIVPSHELAAAFMAGTYGRVDGRPGILLTIPGPGFAFALPGIAEAWQDSAPLLHIVQAAPGGAHARHRHQALDQNTLARTLTKAMFAVKDPARLGETICAAYETARDGEPGPVIVQLGEDAESHGAAPTAADAGAAAAVWRRILAARRPVLFLGQGCTGASAAIGGYVDRTGTPVFTNASGRGVVPENSPWCLGYDSLRGSTAALNALLGEADLVIAVGTRLAYNGTAGHSLALPPERLVHVDASAANLNALYPASLSAVMPAQAFFARPESATAARTGWSEAEVAGWRARIGTVQDRTAEPLIAGGTPQEFFAALRAALPDSALVVTDSGLHQVMARRYFEVRQPHGLLLPTDLQSMGFGLPSALAARLAAPSRPVVALVGDGGMLMSGLELATAVREELDLTVIVFNDGYLNQIRMQQLSDTGQDFGVTLPAMDFQALAAAVGATHRFCEPGQLALLAETGRRGVTLIEVPVTDSRAVTAAAARSRVKSWARRAVGRRASGFLRRLLRRR
jgi:acetolactate synthase-1/2/3 large subunit